ncbi:hypothetical protein H5410_064373, partial [Solanum commersonii]
AAAREEEVLGYLRDHEVIRTYNRESRNRYTYLYVNSFGVADPLAYHSHYRPTWRFIFALHHATTLSYYEVYRRPQPLLTNRISSGSTENIGKAFIQRPITWDYVYEDEVQYTSATIFEEGHGLAAKRKLDTDELRLCLNKPTRNSLKGGLLHNKGAKSVGTIISEMEKELRLHKENIRLTCLTWAIWFSSRLKSPLKFGLKSGRGDTKEKNLWNGLSKQCTMTPIRSRRYWIVRSNRGTWLCSIKFLYVVANGRIYTCIGSA